MSGHWWRAYDDAVDHPKLQRLPLPLFRAWFNLLCLASGNGGVLPPLGDIAFKLRMTEERVSAVLDELQRVRLLDEQRNGDGTHHIVPHNWHDRQFQSHNNSTSKDGAYVYFVGATWDIVKIGISKNPWARVVDFQTGSSEKLIVLAAFRCRANSEIDIHDILAKFRRHGEWFELPKSIIEKIRSAPKKTTYENLLAELRSKDTSTTTDTDSETDTETEKNPKANALGFANKKSRRAPAVAFPPDAVLSDEWLGYATGRGLTVPEAEAEFEKFSNHAQSTDRRCSDWTAAWRNWVIKAPEYRGPANVRNSRPSTSQIAFDLAEQARALERQAGIGRTDDVVGSD